MRVFSIVISLLLLLSTVSSSAELSVPTEFVTIQAAIQAAVDGDCVLVAPGTYTENIDFLGKNITVLGSGGADNTTIDGSGATSSVVLFTNGEGSNAVLDGFTIVGGVGSIGTPVVGRAGGGIYGFGSSPTLRNLRVVDNTAEGRGGGGLLWGVSETLTIDNCEFDQNVAGGAGGLWVEGTGECVLTNSSISNNASTGNLGGFVASTAQLTMTDCQLNGNTTVEENLAYAGGLWLGSPLTTGNQDVVASIVRTELHGNFSSFEAGAFIALDADVVFEECSFRDNEASAHAVGLIDRSTVTFVRCLLAENTTPPTSPALIGISINGFDVIFDRCTITENAGDVLITGPNNSIELRNSIVWNNENPMISLGDGFQASVEYSAVEGGHPGVGNIATDPLFLDPANGDYRLSSASPCIDAGDPAADLDPDGTVIEMGAFPFDQTEPFFRRGDTNVDGQLDIGDGIAVLSGLFGSYAFLCLSAADANDDGVVTVADAVFLFSYQLLGGPPPSAPNDCNADPTPDSLDCSQGC